MEKLYVIFLRGIKKYFHFKSYKESSIIEKALYFYKKVLTCNKQFYAYQVTSQPIILTPKYFNHKRVDGSFVETVNL